MPLELEDVTTWDKTKCQEETNNRIGRVDEIRKDAGGSLAAVSDSERQDEVREKHAELNVIGERIDAIAELEAADARVEDLRAQVNERGGYRPGALSEGGDVRAQVDRRDAGAIFAGSDAIEAFRENKAKEIEAEMPLSSLLPEFAGLDANGFQHPRFQAAVLGSEDALANVDTEFAPESRRVGVLVEQRFQQPNIADLIPQATTNQAAVPFMRETVNSQGAIEVNEGDLIPEASIAFVEDSAPVRKLGVTLPITEEILEDEEMLRGHVNGRLPLFVRNREDGQLLGGNGTGTNLQGILGLSGIDTTTSYSIGGDPTGQDALESIFKASMRVAENFVTPDAAVLGRGLWERLRLAKDANGQYLIAPASDLAVPRVWGLRVVTNQRMPAEAATNEPILVGGFSESSQIWRRRGITLKVSDSHTDRFARDILTLKATSRVAITHYRPGGYATVTSAA